MIARLADTPVLETERLTLRAPGPQDLDAACAFFTTARAGFVGGGDDKDETHAFRVLAIIAGHWVLHGFGTFIAVLRDTGETVGAFGPWYPKGWPEREIGWSLWDPNLEGKGLASEAARVTLEHAYRDLGWETAVSYIAPENAPSQAVAQRLGATLDAAATPPDPGTLVFRHPRADA
ncbi:MAG: GNAT family N-acetyltransferase [Pseudomonadota bacterium]